MGYFLRYVKMFDQHSWESPMDAVAIEVNNYSVLHERYGKTNAEKVLRSIGERLRRLARELGGVGSRQGEGTFLIYCPHQEDYSELLDRLSADLFWDESCNAQVQIQMGIYSFVDKKMEIEHRFEKAKSAASDVKVV